ncbi:DNA repair Rad51-like protein [Ordospora colligata]|uniref:DNA repair Rad51-like protein n=1 Tax=Ordospora colligata OC4 TaxID=1354746 RepID=A0A0B2UL28_9MICR|nr:DNA repair Rad51-like protein [Ordospora colligata OC4]KHN70073.1 DNA repair Rad51-like protein [Ordospora colligata OC4]TBU16455.1 DNA repair Rad51-like protein [Ordospora colligata]TBU16640.1 DNA repair Rad51-like protein [Ordospora colligata]TBU19213.1 DNA repair Rad51-like protein [Ordospora colligata]
MPRLLEYYGLTEITGAPGTGRTAIAIEESKTCSTIYITTKALCTDRYHGSSHEQMDRIIIKRVSTISQLLMFVTNCIEQLIVERGVELVIIDSLDHLLVSEEQGSMGHRSVFTIMNRLKRMNQKYFIDVLAVTCYYGNWVVENFCIENPVLGMQWEYMVNTKYMCIKDHDGRILKLVKSPIQDPHDVVFEIHASSVVIKNRVI